MELRVEGLEEGLTDRQHPTLGNPEIPQPGLRVQRPGLPEVFTRKYRSALRYRPKKTRICDEALAVRYASLHTHSSRAQ